MAKNVCTCMPPSAEQSKSSGTSNLLPARRPYSRPKLLLLGDIRDITLGATPGLGESGSGTQYKLPTGWAPEFEPFDE